jgi:ATP-binding cassette subfamily F protein 3
VAGTVRENLELFGPVDDLDTACRRAGFDDVLADLPDGMATVLGRDGTGLSLGQRQRLGLARAFGAQRPVLLLDEPTSHLDIDSREALIHAINEYEGAVLLITHDIYLAEACADRLWLVYHGRARQYDGDLEDYRKLVAAADRPADDDAKHVTFTQDRAERSPKASKYTWQRKFESAEKEIEQAQAALARIDAALADPDLFSRDRTRGESLLKERAHAATALARAEAAWLEASEALESA